MRLPSRTTLRERPWWRSLRVKARGRAANGKAARRRNRAGRVLRLFWFVTRRVAARSYTDNLNGLAAQMAFYFLLAVFPFLLLLTTMLPFVSEPASLEKLMPMIERIVPEEAIGYVRANLQKILTERREGLISLSALMLLWSASSGLQAVMDGLNIAYRVRETRAMWRARLIAIVVTLLLGALTLISISLLVFGELLNELVAKHLSEGVIFWAVMRWVAALAFLMLAMDIVYYATPNVLHRWRWFSPGSLTATLTLVGISLSLSWYITRFGRYEATYGALAAVISLMLWFYFAGLALLFGGEINAVLELEVYREARPIGPAERRH